MFVFFQVQSKMFSALTANRDRQCRTPFYKLSFFSLYTVSCFFMVTESHLCLNMTLPSWPLVSSIYKVLCENCLLFPIILRRCIWEALTVLLWGPADISAAFTGPSLVSVIWRGADIVAAAEDPSSPPSLAFSLPNKRPFLIFFRNNCGHLLKTGAWMDA